MRGYRKKPFWIYLLGGSYFILPILTLVQFWVKLDHSLALLKEVLLSDFFLLELFCSVTAGLAVLIVSRIGFLYLIVLSVCTLSIKIYNLAHFPLFESPFNAAVVSFWLSMTLAFLFTTLRVPYLNPRVRWWRQPPRYSLFARGVLTVRRLRFPVVTLDLSVGGIFLKVDERLLSLGEGVREFAEWRFKERRTNEPIGSPVMSAQEIEIARGQIGSFPQGLGETVKVRIQTVPEARHLFPENHLESDVEVVWRSTDKGRYRYGLGLKFIRQSEGERKRLSQYLRLLRRSGYHERERE